MTYTKTSSCVDYGKGTPGWGWEVCLYRGDELIARAFGPNVNGIHTGLFRDLAAVREFRQLPDGPVDADTVSRLVCPWILKP